VPADMVIVSGSGLDPHITLKNALYQLDCVAGRLGGEDRSEQSRCPLKNRESFEGKTGSPLRRPGGGTVGERPGDQHGPRRASDARGAVKPWSVCVPSEAKSGGWESPDEPRTGFQFQFRSPREASRRFNFSPIPTARFL
jgi:hypothetical protein